MDKEKNKARNAKTFLYEALYKFFYQRYSPDLLLL